MSLKLRLALTSAVLRHCALLVGLVLAQTACMKAIPTTGTFEEQGGTTGNSVMGGSAGLTGTGGGAGVAATASRFGRNCDSSLPCDADLQCYAADGTDFDGYGPAGGYCSTSCTSDAECTNLDPTARCVELVMPRSPLPKICVSGCVLGDPIACGSREDVACWPVDGGANASSDRVCLPTCNHDSQCPTGMLCDGYYNLCTVTVPASGSKLGSACEPTAATNVCSEGFCVELDGGGVCSAYCRRGTFPQCGGAKALSVCAWAFTGDEAAGVADVGLCTSTCACDADCVFGSHCELQSDRTGMSKPGLCVMGAETGIEICT